MAINLKKTPLPLSITRLVSATIFAGLISIGVCIIQINNELPNTKIINSLELKVPLRIYSSENLLISEYGNEYRKPLKLEAFPNALIQSVLSTEDNKFYFHSGIDIWGLFRATSINFLSSKKAQGASTITMQLARNYFLNPEKTYFRKIKEIFLAIRLEQLLSKDQILSLYLNKVFLGHRAYGFGAAATVYYGKELSQLTLAETAMLAGLPKAPSSNNPLRNPNLAIKRRNHVLKRLLDTNKINVSDYKIATSAPITAKKHARKNQLYAPYIAEIVRAKLVQKFGKSAYWEGIKVYTTIQADMQNAATASLREGLLAYDRRHGFRGAITNISLTSTLKKAGINAAVLDKKDWYNNTTDAIEQALLNTLDDFPRITDLIPSLVLDVQENMAILTSLSKNRIQLNLNDLNWAKKHKTNNIVGKKPTSVKEVLKVGDIVYLRKAQPKNQAHQNKIWQLSQIPNIEGSLISMQPSTGKIIALVGGYDYFQNKFNRATQSIRQAGSNIKPFIYSASLDNGYMPYSLISGAPIVIKDKQHGTLWRPENYSKTFFGPTRMRVALAKSLNLVSIRLLRTIGIPFAQEYLQRFGFNIEQFSSGLTMALGSGGVTPMEMVTAYSTLANSGYKVTPQFIAKIEDRNGNILYQTPTIEYCDACYTNYLPEIKNKIDLLLSEHTSNNLEKDAQNNELNQDNTTQVLPNNKTVFPRVMSIDNNFLTVDMLKDVIRTGTARKALSLNRSDLAGKTGTTNDYVDAWFSGFNPEIATTVWVGFDTPQTMGKSESGSKAALPIWVSYMKKIAPHFPEKHNKIPDYISAVSINKTTGKMTTQDDPNSIQEYTVIPELLPNYYEKKINALLSQGLVSQETLRQHELKQPSQTNRESQQSNHTYLENQKNNHTLNNGFTNENTRPSTQTNDLGNQEQSTVPPKAKEKIIEDELEIEGLF